MILNKLLKWVANCIKLAPLQILTIFVMSGIWSCGSSKKAQKHSEVVKIETSTQSSDSSSLIKHSLITAADSTTEDLVVTITEYDTSMPVDSLTKKPPVKKEVKVNKHLNVKKSLEKKLKDKQELSTVIANNVQHQDSIFVDIVKEKKGTTIIKQIYILLAILLAICLLRIKYKNAKQ